MKADIAFVIRADDELQAHGFERVTVETSHGPVERVYLAEIDGVHVAMIYGRHEEKRVPSTRINFMKAQEAMNRLGVKIVIGSFITGSIAADARRGELYIPDDLVGVGGGYDQSMYQEEKFRNLDALHIFCEPARQALIAAAKDQNIAVHERGTYACFHTYPRYETRGELAHYEQMKLDIVGQTLDPEATLARESACCYAAICVTIDDVEVRERKAQGDREFCDNAIKACVAQGRLDMAKIMFSALPRLKVLLETSCDCRIDFHHKGPDHFMRPAPYFDVPYRGVLKLEP